MTMMAIVQTCHKKTKTFKVRQLALPHKILSAQQMYYKTQGRLLSLWKERGWKNRKTYQGNIAFRILYCIKFCEFSSIYY